MICTKKEFIRTGADGTKWWQVVLTADTDPDTLNLTGADVENLNDALGLAAGSILITPTANYIAFEDGVFTAKGEGGGGGGGGGGDAQIEITFNPNDSGYAYFYAASIVGLNDASPNVVEPGETFMTVTIPENYYMAFAGARVDNIVGNIETAEDGVYLIKGDGAFSLQMDY